MASVLRLKGEASRLSLYGRRFSGRVRVKGFSKDSEVDPFTRNMRHGDNAQVECGRRVHEEIVGGRLKDDRIAGACYRSKGRGNRVERSVVNDDVAREHLCFERTIVPRELLSQSDTPGGRSILTHRVA